MDLATRAVEALVGAACIAIAVGARRGGGRSWLAVALGVAGVAAVGHAALG